jgi:carbon monoxide dehydrogenase subunit G
MRRGDPLHFSERLEVPAPLAEAWAFIWDAPRLAGCLPGCVGVEEIEPGKLYRARFEDHVGPYKVHFDLNIEVKETQPLERVRIFASGRDPRLGITQRVDLTVELRDAGLAGTALAVEAEVEILGKVATLGQFVVKRKAQEVVRGFTHNIEAELRPAPAGRSAGESSA